jgi:hypothetical protein
LVNCFHLSIPFWTGDIPAPLVDVAPDDRNAGEAVKFGDGKKRETPATKEKR